MESLSALHALLPDIQNSICENFSNVECCVEQTPRLSEPPFNFGFDTVGRKVHLLPSGTSLPKDFHLIASLPEGDVISDGQCAEAIHLVLAGGDDWRTPIQQLFNEKSASDWAILVLELQSGSAHFQILSPHTKCTPKQIESVVLWLVPLCTEPPPKPKLVKKVLVKKSPEKTPATTSGSSIKTTKTSNGTKIVRKKIVTKDGVVALNGDLKDKSPSDSDGTAKKAGSSSEKTLKGREVTKRAERANGDGSGIDSGISLADSDNEKSQRNDVNASEGDDQDKEKMEASMNDWVTPCTTPDSALKAVEAEATFVPKKDNKHNEDISTSFTMTLPNSEPMTSARPEAAEMENTVEEEEKHCPNIGKGYGCVFGDATKVRLLNDVGCNDERCSPELSSSSSRLSPPSDASDRVTPKQQTAISERRKPALPSARERDIPSRGGVEMPVQVLQQVLKQFTYKELGEMRRVHPYWDELCGQALNSGYYELVKKADKMLTDCQRRVHNERELHDVLALLTNVQVHILNPIDILRPAMDEGVCCFLYGDLLDKLFAIVAKAKRMMNGEYNLIVDWKSVAELARRAQIHYKTNLEAVMEEKLSDVVRLKALQRIQRIDSFIVDSTVNKLEKAAHMARDDLEWEIEQLRQQNSQLRKDNRELKKDYMRLESRIEVLENKFRTMARLLQ